VKFLGGAEAFKPEQLSEAVRAAAGALVDPSTDEVTPEEREAVREVFDALGLVPEDDERNAMGGRTMSHNSPLDY